MRHLFALCAGFVAVLISSLGCGWAAEVAQSSAFPCPENEIARYTAYQVVEPIRIDGKLDEAVWSRAPQSPRFVDILTGDRTIHSTHAMVVWDETNLYVAYRIEEPFVHAKFTKHNDPIYYDNDVEFFIAGRDAYYEFEINAFNTSYEVFFVWNDAYDRGGFNGLPEFERAKLAPFNGLQTAVQVDGTVNKDDDRDRGWTVEIALPWKSLQWLAKTDNRPLPPKEGDEWRMDFSRFNTYKEAPPAKDSGGWVWTRHGIWDSHIPECFARVSFSTKPVPAVRSVPIRR